MEVEDERRLYDHIRCPVCAMPWPEHPEDTICRRYKPKDSVPPEQLPKSVLVNLPRPSMNGEVSNEA